jgi:hypothetical protein
MQIHVKTGSTSGQDTFIVRIESKVRNTLGWLGGRITRVDVRVRDENGDKGGDDDKRCVMEARLRGRQPVAVTYHAATVEAAVGGAVGKLRAFLKSTVGRLRSR